MSPALGTAVGKVKTAKSDADLVRECLRGHEPAWAELISKYKNLIYSIPVRLGLSQEEASDIFQSVSLELFCKLSDLRDPQALAGWLIRVTQNKCFHKRRENQRYCAEDDTDGELPGICADAPEKIIQQIEREEFVRMVICELNPRCRALVEKLFFEAPARPYEEVARDLGLAAGSIGIMRRRCLDRLRDRLEELGVR